jgi:hypothetical protein
MTTSRKMSGDLHPIKSCPCRAHTKRCWVTSGPLRAPAAPERRRYVLGKFIGRSIGHAHS